MSKLMDNPIVVTEPINGVYHAIFENQYLVSSTFMRLQEFYESPFENIKGDTFTHEEYMDVSMKEIGKFDYLTKWNGFNVPGNVVREFFEKFCDFSAKELLLKQLLQKVLDSENNFYLIGTHKEAPACIDHEYAHAMYYLDKDYMNEISNLLIGINEVERLKMMEVLRNDGYCNEVMNDEIHAYISTSSMMYLHEEFENFNVEWDTVFKFQECFNAYKKKNKIKRVTV